MLHFGAFKRRFEPPERPVLLPTPGNSHTPDPMRSLAFVASSDYVVIGVDSMASDHFFGDRDAFDAATLVALAPADAPQIEVADGVEHAPTHQGVVPLRVRGYGKYSGSDRTIKLLNAKLVPGFPSHQRLVSSGRLEHDNTINGVQRVVVDSMNAAIHMRDANGKTYYSFSLDKSGCVTQLPCVFGSALRGDGGSADAVYCCAAAPTRSPPVSSLTMHKRLMHASPRAIADTVAHTQGSKLTDDPLKLTTPIDEASLRGKGHRVSHDAGPQLQLPGNRSSEMIEELSMDHHGPFPPSKRGNTGFYNFVTKNGSQLIVSVKSTSDGLACLKMAHMQLGKPKYLRMDRQSNLLSTNPSNRTEFEAFNDSVGTCLKTTAPDTANQNGLAESAGRCAYEAATATAVSSGVPIKVYWDHAVETYAYVKTRTGTTKHDGKTPYELDFKHPPYVGHLRRPFCPAFAVLVKDQRPTPRAFADRVARCVFVGYPLDQKPGTYLLYNLETKRLITSRNVYFDEEFRFVERTTGADGAPAWLFKLDADTTAVESQLSHADGDAITHAATLAGDFLESVGVPPVGETVGVGGSVGEKNNGSTHSTHATLSTTTASFTVAQLVASNSDIYVKPNSKRPGTASGDRFAKYQSARSVSEYLKLGGTKSDLANDLKKGIVTVKVKVFDDDGDVMPELVEASDSDDDDDMPSKKQEGKGDTIDATTDEPKDDGADDATKADDDDTQVTFGDVTIDVPTVEVRRSNRLAGGTAFTTVTRKSTVPPPVLKVHLECDFTKCDKTFHNFEADLPADRVDENRKAYKAEFDGMVDSGSLSQPVSLPHGHVPVPMIMIGKIKTPTEKDPKGKLKWRACPKGFKQRDGLNYDADDIHAPVMDKTTLRVLLSIGNSRDANLRQADVTQAFLWADLDEEVYVTAPPGYDLGRDDHGRPLVFRVLKAIYGLKQSPACWYKLISRWLLDQGYQQSGYDQCLFHAWRNADGQIDPSQSPDDQNDDFMFIGFHVDDFLTVTTDKQWETEFLDSLRSRFDITDLGEPTQLLGLNIERDKTARSLKISCPTVLNDMLENTGMTGAYPTTSPAMNPEPTDLITADNEYRHEGLDPAKVIGSMQYAASSCRPDLALVCSSLGSERQKKTLAGLKNLKRSIGYVAGTVNMGLIYHGATTSRFAQITVYVDSEFGGDLKLTMNPTGRPRYGFGIFVGNDLVAYRTKSADTVVLSSANAEIIGLSEACRHLTWTRNLLKDLGFKLSPTVVYEDNAAAISIATRAYLTSRTRHIHLRDLYVRELVTNGDVEIRYVKTNENIADFFTKFQPVATFRIHRDILMGICPVKRA